MIRIAIAEDEEEASQTLYSALMRYADTHDTRFQISLFTDGEDLLNAYQGQYDILFLDIQLEGLDGISTAQRVRELDKEVQIFFVTNMVHRAIDGYGLSAAGFLVKPVNDCSLFRHLDRAIQEAAQKESGYLVLGSAREIWRIALNSILYIESMGHYVKVHTEQGQAVAHSTMRAIENQLSGKPFFRCSNACIVNLDKISAVVNYHIYIEKEELGISRKRKKELMTALNRHLSGLLP